MPTDASAVDAIANLADSSVDERTLVTGIPADDESVRVIRRRHDEDLETLDLERHLLEPRRARGGAVLHDPDSFAAYVNRVATSSTTVWADQSTRKVTAVVNDSAGPGEAGWRDHTVTLELQVDPEWAAWLALDGNLVEQLKMAEHLDAYGTNVVEPDGATMLEVASSIRATRSAEFESQTKDATGDVVLRYKETTRAKAGERGTLEVPERFRVRIAPYVGFDPVDLDAMFRMRITSEGDRNPGTLTLGYRLHRPDLVLRAAFDRVRESIEAELGDTPVYSGVAPGAVTSSNAGR